VVEWEQSTTKGFEPLEPDIYDVEVTNAEFTVAKTGSPMYKLTFTVFNGPYKGRKVWSNLVLKADSPGSAGFFFGNMSRLGLSAEFFATVSGEAAEAKVCAALIGRRVQIKVKLGEPFQGNVRNEVEAIIPLTEDQVTRGDAAAAQGTDAAIAAASVSKSPGLPPGI